MSVALPMHDDALGYKDSGYGLNMLIGEWEGYIPREPGVTTLYVCTENTG